MNLKLLSLVLFQLFSLYKAQFVATNYPKNQEEENLISIKKDYNPTFNDCPLQYYEFGGKYLASSIALNYNFHHNYSHFTELSEAPENTFCNGILISDEWVLTTEKCRYVELAKFGYDHEGQLTNFTAHSVKKYKIKDQLALLHIDSVNFTGRVSSACLLHDLKNYQEFFLKGKSIDHEFDEKSLKIYQDLQIILHKVVPFVAIDVANFTSYISWIEDQTNLNFTPKACATRYLDTRRYEHYTSRSTSDPNEEQIIPLNSLIQSYSSRGYRVSIFNETEYKCAGILLKNQYFLSVASCNIEVGFKVKIRDLEKDIEVVDVFVHENFDENTLENNIVVFQTSELPEFSDAFYPACIPTFEIEELGQLHRQTGNFQLNCGYQGCTDEPAITNVLIISNITQEEDCLKMYNTSDITVNYTTDFCSGNSERLVPSTCLNDIGGPIGRQIYYKSRYFNYVFGLNSYGEDCGCNYPTLAVRLSSYRDWISNKTNISLSKGKKDDRNLIKRAKMCIESELDLSSFEKRYKGCQGVAANDQFWTVEICSAGKKNFNAKNSIASIGNPKAKSFPSECVWDDLEKVPFVTVVSFNETLYDFFSTFSSECEKKHNVTLGNGEFCIESYWKIDDIEDEITPGSAVWYPQSVNYSPQRSILIGLVRFSKKIEDDRFFAIVTILKSNDSFT